MTDFDDILAVQAQDDDQWDAVQAVISDLPSDEDALTYWRALTTLADMPGFAEAERTLRTVPATALTAPMRGQTTTVS